MAEFHTGQIVFSKCGRDQGRTFLVVKIEGEFLYLADGVLRKLEKPKKKKKRHVMPTKYIDLPLKEKLEKHQYLLDADLRQSIDRYMDLNCSNKEVKYLV